MLATSPRKRGEVKNETARLFETRIGAGTVCESGRSSIPRRRKAEERPESRFPLPLKTLYGAARLRHQAKL
jgi:hypothetical protein